MTPVSSVAFVPLRLCVKKTTAKLPVALFGYFRKPPVSFSNPRHLTGIKVYIVWKHRLRRSKVNKSKTDLKLQELLSAYLDGELADADRAVVEALLRKNSDYAELVEEWRHNGSKMRALPKSTLDAGFAGRVLQQLSHL